MLSDREIKANLSALDAQFNSATNTRDANFSSKLAVLEFCGWIEEAMDQIAEQCYLRCVSESPNRKLCKEAIRGTNGFEYHQHFRRMLTSIIGQTGMERLERKADGAKLDMLRSALSTLKTVRDGYAHSYLKGTTQTLSAPSFLISQFPAIADGLREIEARISERTW